MENCAVEAIWSSAAGAAKWSPNMLAFCSAVCSLVGRDLCLSPTSRPANLSPQKACSGGIFSTDPIPIGMQHLLWRLLGLDPASSGGLLAAVGHPAVWDPHRGWNPLLCIDYGISQIFRTCQGALPVDKRLASKSSAADGVHRQNYCPVGPARRHSWPVQRCFLIVIDGSSAYNWSSWEGIHGAGCGMIGGCDAAAAFPKR